VYAPALGLAQFNRNLAAATGGPTITDLRDSGELENTAGSWIGAVP
jgi:hypothetical protein